AILAAGPRKLPFWQQLELVDKICYNATQNETKSEQHFICIIHSIFPYWKNQIRNKANTNKTNNKSNTKTSPVYI
ncbi:hypothetical protein EBZ38_12345, partial [bacterium]|nr:hypothetical protein [bacterium]NDD85046.1 hypothetical protein [bacterium]